MYLLPSSWYPHSCFRWRFRPLYWVTCVIVFAHSQPQVTAWQVLAGWRRALPTCHVSCPRGWERTGRLGGLLPRKHFTFWGLRKARILKPVLKYNMPRSLGMNSLYSSSFYPIHAFILQTFSAGLLSKRVVEIKCNKHHPHVLMGGLLVAGCSPGYTDYLAFSLYQTMNTVLIFPISR